MSNTDQNTDFPFSHNINIVQLAGILATLGVMFGLKLTQVQLEDFLTVIFVLWGAATAFIHTFVNHPANKQAAMAMVQTAVRIAKTNKNMLAFVMTIVTLMIIAPTISACSTFGPIQQDPQTILKETEAAFAIAEAGYDAICSVNSPPSFCTDPTAEADYAKAKLVLEAAFNTAQAAITASGDTNTQAINDLLAALAQDWATYNDIVSKTKALHAAGVR